MWRVSKCRGVLVRRLGSRPIQSPIQPAYGVAGIYGNRVIDGHTTFDGTLRKASRLGAFDHQLTGRNQVPRYAMTPTAAMKAGILAVGE